MKLVEVEIMVVVFDICRVFLVGKVYWELVEMWWELMCLLVFNVVLEVEFWVIKVEFVVC